ncbi:MAG: tetratricopeptide repeat protein [Candidatus Poseidoniales archaeon]
MVANKDSESVPSDESDALDEVALASVNQALEAVENEEVVEETPADEQRSQPPRNVIPELEDVEDPEEMVQVLLTVGEERSRRGDVKGALAAFNKAIALDPSCDMAWFNRGVLLEAQQDARGARQSFQICLDLNDQHAPATANLSILLERIGDLEGAYEMAGKALSFFPGHPALVALQERCKDSEIAVSIEAMQPSVEVTQAVDMAVVEEIAEEAGIENPEDLLNEAVHHDHDEDATLTVEELQSAAEVVVAQQDVLREVERAEPQPEPAPEPQEPEIDIDALVESATNSIKEGQPKQALELLKPHLKTIAAQHAGAWRIAGGAMARLDLDNHAIAAMTHAQNLEPSHAPGWFNLGSVQQRSDLIQEALSSYKRAIEADPAYEKAAEKMADLAQEHGRIETYMDAARSLIKMNPHHHIREAYIAMLLQLAQGESDIMDQVAGLPPTLPAGPEMAQEALELMDEAPSSQRALALSLSLQHSDAVLMWKAMIQQESNEPSHWTGLARSLEQAGDLETAAKCHAKAAAMAGTLGTGVAANPVQATQSVPPVQTEPTAVVNTAPAAGFADPLTTPQPVVIQDATLQPASATVADDAALLLTPMEPKPKAEAALSPQVDLAKAALDAAQTLSANTPQSTSSNAISNQDVAWFNQGVQLIEDKKYREALSCFDRALPAFAGDDAMIIRILNNRGNAYYFLEDYPKCVESYHQAMLIRPTEVRGETLYNMGTAYAEMERYNDAIKCFEQAMPRGLSDEAKRRAKDQIRRCNILQKALDKKRKKR